jgi:hypothetical protein
VLFITRGFRDQLRIAYQNRPRIFDRHIRLPELLYRKVVEVDERVGARGDVVRALDEKGGAARASPRPAPKAIPRSPSSSCTATASPPMRRGSRSWHARPGSSRCPRRTP